MFPLVSELAGDAIEGVGAIATGLLCAWAPVAAIVLCADEVSRWSVHRIMLASRYETDHVFVSVERYILLTHVFI